MLRENSEAVTTFDVVKKVKTGLGNGRGTLLLAIAGIAVSLCSSFMFCLASIGFDFSQLREAVFWSRWASMMISSLCAYVFVILHKDEVNRLNEWYVLNTKSIAEKSRTAGEEFESYLRELNLQRRIEWHKRKMNAKIGKLNQKLLRASLKHRAMGPIEEAIKKYKFCISEEYISANKNFLRTRSKPISSAQVLSETQRGDDGEVNFRSVSMYYGGKAIMKLCLSLCSTAAFSCVVVKNFEAGINIASVVMTVLTVLSLFISVLSAIMAANGCYKNVYVPNLIFKLKILSDYENWRVNGKKR